MHIHMGREGGCRCIHIRRGQEERRHHMHIRSTRLRMAAAAGLVVVAAAAWSARCLLRVNTSTGSYRVCK